MVRSELSFWGDFYRVRRLRCQRSGQNYRGQGYRRASKLFQGYSAEQFANLFLCLPRGMGGRWASSPGGPDHVPGFVRSQREEKVVIANQKSDGSLGGLGGR